MAPYTPLLNGFCLRFLLALAGFCGLTGLAAAENLIAQRFLSGQPDAELESVLYLTAGVALADLGYSSAKTAAQADYVLTAEYSVRDSEAEVKLSLAAVKDQGREIAAVDAHLHLGLSLDAELGDALKRLLELAALDRPKDGGSGYPWGLSGEAIPLPGRIVSVVDVFDALVSDRPYKPAWSKESALEYIVGQRGLQFDPALVDIFQSHIAEFAEIWDGLQEAPGYGV